MMGFLFTIVLSFAGEDCERPKSIDLSQQRNQGLLERIQYEYIQNLVDRKEAVTIAVIGDGVHVDEFKGMVDINHEEIPDNNFDDDLNGYVDDYAGFNFAKGTGSHFAPHAGHTHETMVASSIALVSNFHCEQKYPIKILPLSIAIDKPTFDRDYYLKVALAIDYAVSRKVKIINMSFGSSAFYQSMWKFIDNDVYKSLDFFQAAIARAEKAGVLVMAAASNDINRNQDVEAQLPCNIKGVFCVSGVDFSHKLKRAHGQSIMNAFYSEEIYLYQGRNKYVYESGNSFATPMMAAVVAMKWAQEPEIPLSKMKTKIERASNIPVQGRKKVRLGVFNSVDFFGL